MPCYFNQILINGGYHNLTKPDKLYINSTPTRLLQRSKHDLIEYKNKIFPNNPHIHLRACDAASSYHCPYPITVSNITK